MKRINQYFCAGCIAYTAASIIGIIMHLIDHSETFQVKSDASMIIIIALVQVILYFMENLQIKSQIAHMASELFIIILITFAAGVPMKLIIPYSISDIIEIIIIISFTYGTTMLSLYISGKNDAECINKKLQEHR